METPLIISIFSAINKFSSESFSDASERRKREAREKMIELLSLINTYIEKRKGNEDDKVWTILVSEEIQRKLLIISGYIENGSGYVSSVLEGSYNPTKESFEKFQKLVTIKLAKQSLVDLIYWKDYVLTTIQTELIAAITNYKKEHKITENSRYNEIEQRKLNNFDTCLKEIKKQQEEIDNLLAPLATSNNQDNDIEYFAGKKVNPEIVQKHIKRTKQILYDLRLGVKDYTSVLNKLNGKPNIFEYLFTKVCELLKIKTQTEKKVLGIQSELVPVSQRHLEAWIANVDSSFVPLAKSFKQMPFAISRTPQDQVKLLGSLVERWFNDEISYNTMKSEGAKLVKKINKQKIKFNREDNLLGYELYAFLHDHKSKPTFFIGIYDYLIAGAKNQEALISKLGEVVEDYLMNKISYETLINKGKFYKTIIDTAHTIAESNKQLAEQHGGPLSPIFRRKRDESIDNRLPKEQQPSFLLGKHLLNHLEDKSKKIEFERDLQRASEESSEDTGSLVKTSAASSELNEESAVSLNHNPHSF